MEAKLQAAEARLQATEAKLRSAEQRAEDRERLTTFVTGKTSPKAEKSEQSEPRKLEAVVRPAPTREEEERLRLIAEQKERQQALANRLIQDNERKSSVGKSWRCKRSESERRRSWPSVTSRRP